MKTELIHNFNVNTLIIDKEIKELFDKEINLFLTPLEIEENAVVGAIWDTAGDTRVCPLCESLSGQIFPVESGEFARLEPPIHVSCRCMMRYVTGRQRGIDERLKEYQPVDPDLLQKWSSKIYTDVEIREMAKAVKEVKPVPKKIEPIPKKVEPVSYKGTVDSESERILRAGLRTKTEHGSAIDSSGKVIVKRAGKSPTKVTLTADDFEKMRVGKAKTFIHNHPTGVSFSAGDINFANKLNLDEVMAVGKKYRYVIKPKPGGRWPTADLDELNGMWNSARDATQAKYNAIYKEARGKLDWEELYRQQTHEIMEGMSKKLGLVYKRSVW